MNALIDKLFERGAILVAFIIGSFHLLNVSGVFVLSTRDIRIFHLMMMLALLYMTRATLDRWRQSLTDKFFRIGLIIVSTTTCVYFMSRWKDIALSGGETVALDAWMGVVLLLLVLEAARRGVGLVLAIICLIFFTYPFYSSYLPGVLYGRGYSLTRISEFLTTTSQGVLAFLWEFQPPTLFYFLFTARSCRTLVRAIFSSSWHPGSLEVCSPQVPKQP